MTIKKYILPMAVLACLGFTACDTDVEGESYSPEAANVSFETAEPSEVETDQTSVEVPVRIIRADKSGAYTAHYTMDAADVFTDDLGGTVDFAAGEAVKVITLTAADLEEETTYTATLTLSDADIATADTTTKSQITSTVVTVTRLGSWSDWTAYNSAGTADYYYEQFFSGEDPDLNFYWRYNLKNESSIQFRLEHWGYDVDFYVNYDASTGIVTVDPQYIGYTHSNYGDVYITDYNNYWTNVRGEEADPIYGSFDAEQGIITIPVVYYVDAGYFGAGYEYIYIDGFSRADVSCSVTYSGKFISAAGNTSIVADVTLGDDVTSAYLALVPGDLTQDALDSIIAGTYSPIQEITASGEYSFDADSLADGDYTLVVVPFLDGEAQEYASAEFTYAASNDTETFKELYVGNYTYTLFFTNEDGSAYVDEGLTLSQSEKDGTRFKIAHWGYDVDFIFTFDSDGNVVVADQETGYVHPTYGAVMVDDLTDYTGGSSYGVSSYDSQTGTFTFNVIYYVDAGNFGYGPETFAITGSASARAAVEQARKKAMEQGGKTVKNDKLRPHDLRLRGNIATIPVIK